MVSYPSWKVHTVGIDWMYCVGNLQVAYSEVDDDRQVCSAMEDDEHADVDVFNDDYACADDLQD